MEYILGQTERERLNYLIEEIIVQSLKLLAENLRDTKEALRELNRVIDKEVEELDGK